MITWSGWGFLVAVVVFGASLVMELASESFTGDDTFYQTQPWPLAVALVVAGLLTWLVGRYLDARGARGGGHLFFFVPMQHWGPVLIGIGVLAFVLRRPG